ncbi:MAG: UbiA family prenyltransferase, partial [Anaerolineales bacterium]
MQTFIKLTRWREFIPFTLPLSLLGGLLAHRFAPDVTLDWRLLAIVVANCLAMSYAFMINDIEDAEDDKHGNPERAARNVIASGELTPRVAWIASSLIATIALGLYALGGLETFLTGGVIVVLAHLYSWKPVRLKSLPLLDIISHVLFLSALLLLAPYLIYTSTLQPEIWAMMISAALFSA